jgi:hypothetical protein
MSGGYNLRFPSVSKPLQILTSLYKKTVQSSELKVPWKRKILQIIRSFNFFGTWNLEPETNSFPSVSKPYLPLSIICRIKRTMASCALAAGLSISVAAGHIAVCLGRLADILMMQYTVFTYSVPRSWDRIMAGIAGVPKIITCLVFRVKAYAVTMTARNTAIRNKVSAIYQVMMIPAADFQSMRYTENRPQVVMAAVTGWSACIPPFKVAVMTLRLIAASFRKPVIAAVINITEWRTRVMKAVNPVFRHIFIRNIARSLHNINKRHNDKNNNSRYKTKQPCFSFYSRSFRKHIFSPEHEIPL